MKNPGRIGVVHSSTHRHVWFLQRHHALQGLIELGVGLPFTLPERRLRAADCQATGREPLEGPYFFGEPEERRRTGAGLVIRGAVRDAVTRQPVPGATIVRWHSNASGVYEDRYRALMVADGGGAYEMETIVPGIHAGLARHVHFHVSAPGYGDLITQIQWNNAMLPDRENYLDFALQPVEPPGG